MYDTSLQIALSGYLVILTGSLQESRELGILKSFEFVSQLRRASVIVRQFGQKSGDIFVKGAPEAMREICREDSCE